MNNPKISVITVVRNGAEVIEQTMLSVLNQTYSNIEYIVVDGASTDGTFGAITNYELRIRNGEFPNVAFRCVSERDGGIYDAMNKGLAMATGEWINFMNAGDVFCKNDVLQNIFCKSFPSEIQFLYSDFMVKRDERYDVTIEASFDKGVLIHQSIIYKKELHNRYGLYAVTPKIILSDYLFFNLIPKEQMCKVDTVISLNAATGAASGEWCPLQKFALDYVFYRISLPKMLWKIFDLKLREWTKKIIGQKTAMRIKFGMGLWKTPFLRGIEKGVIAHKNTENPKNSPQ